MNAFVATAFQGAIVLGLAPFAAGLVRWCKARLQGRHGASPFLPYVTLATLLKKEAVISPTTSWMFRVAPFVVLGSAVATVLLTPLTTAHGALATFGSFMVVAGLLSLGSVFLVLGGLDAGSAFGGMGASREMTLAALVEPSVIFAFAGFAVASGSGSVTDMMAVGGRGLLAMPGLLLSLGALGLILLAENARYPVDNPATHLELTMVHEAMILEYSGTYLAMLEYASFIKLTMFALLFANFVCPTFTLGAGLVGAAAAAAVKLVVMMGALALLENSLVKMRFYRMQEYMAVSFFLSLAGLAAVLLQKI